MRHRGEPVGSGSGLSTSNAEITFGVAANDASNGSVLPWSVLSPGRLRCGGLNTGTISQWIKLGTPSALPGGAITVTGMALAGNLRVGWGGSTPTGDTEVAYLIISGGTGAIAGSSNIGSIPYIYPSATPNLPAPSIFHTVSIPAASWSTAYFALCFAPSIGAGFTAFGTGEVEFFDRVLIRYTH
jgi:hypothetical protein